MRNQPREPKPFTSEQISAAGEILTFMAGYLPRQDEWIDPASMATHERMKTETKRVQGLLETGKLTMDELRTYRNEIEQGYGVNRGRHPRFTEKLDALIEIVGG